MCLIQVQAPKKRSGASLSQHWNLNFSILSASLARFRPPFSTKRISPLNNLSACLFWLRFSAETWIWSGLLWRGRPLLCYKKGMRGLKLVSLFWGAWMGSSCMFWNFFGCSQMWLAQNPLMMSKTVFRFFFTTSPVWDSMSAINLILAYFSEHSVSFNHHQFCTISQFNYSDFSLIHLKHHDDDARG